MPLPCNIARLTLLSALSVLSIKTSMQPSAKSALTLYLAIGVLSAVVFGVDTQTRVGYAEWLL